MNERQMEECSKRLGIPIGKVRKANKWLDDYYGKKRKENCNDRDNGE